MKKVFFAGIAAALLASIASFPAAASEPPQAASFDVAGIRLGMSPAQVTARIAAYDSTLSVQTQTFCGLFRDDECERYKSIVPIAQIVANRTAYYNTSDAYGEKIVVQFSLVPGAERVIAVTLIRTYTKEPNAEDVERAVLKKFPASSIRGAKPGLRIGTFFDASGRSINDQSASATDAGVMINETLASGQQSVVRSPRLGVSYAAYVGDVSGVTPQFTVTLYDDGELYAAGRAAERFNDHVVAMRAAAAHQNTVGKSF